MKSKHINNLLYENFNIDGNLGKNNGKPRDQYKLFKLINEDCRIIIGHVIIEETIFYLGSIIS